MKESLCTALGLMGAALSWAFGGWDAALTALMICISVDYISGSLVALVFHKSNKSETGSYNSTYGLKGLCKKCLMLLFVIQLCAAAMFLMLIAQMIGVSSLTFMMR